jgi:hypothetical protein
VLPIAARLGERRAAEAAAHADDPPTWQVHEAMVGLAFDFQEAREADEAVRVRERRVQELGGGAEEARRRRGTATRATRGAGAAAVERKKSETRAQYKRRIHRQHKER